MIKKLLLSLSAFFFLFLLSAVFTNSSVRAQQACCDVTFRYCALSSTTFGCTSDTICTTGTVLDGIYRCTSQQTCNANVLNPRGTCSTTTPSPTPTVQPTIAPTVAPTSPPSTPFPTQPPTGCNPGQNCCRCGIGYNGVCGIYLNLCDPTGFVPSCSTYAQCNYGSTSCTCIPQSSSICGNQGQQCCTTTNPPCYGSLTCDHGYCIALPTPAPHGNCTGHFTHQEGECYFLNCPQDTLWDGLNPPYDDTHCDIGYSCCVPLTNQITPRPLLNPRCTTGSGAQGIDTAVGCIASSNITSFLTFMLPWALGLGGGVALALIVVAAFLIMTSSGNPERLQAGKELLVSAIMGLLMLIFSVFLLDLIGVRILRIPGL